MIRAKLQRITIIIGVCILTSVTGTLLALAGEN
jgi:hypothetical protein